MAQFLNHTRNKAEQDIKLILLQWLTFNEQHWLRSEMGLNSNTLLEEINNRVINFGATYYIDFFQSKEIGRSKTRIDSFKGLDIINVDFEKLFDRDNFPILPLVMYKTDSETLDFTPDNMDPTTFTNCRVVDVNWMGVPAMFSEFKNTLIKNVEAQYSNFAGSLFDNCTLKNCDFDKALISLDDIYFYTYDAFQISGQFNNSKVEDCTFRQAEIESFHVFNTRFTRCDFSGASMPGTKPNGIKGMVATDCKFNNVEFVGNQVGLDAKFIDCEFRNAQIGVTSGTRFLVDCHNTDWEDSTFTRLILRGDHCNSNFKNVQFTNVALPISDAGTDLCGANFTGSNLDDYYTRTEFKAIANIKYNERTLWVDGTPL